MTSDTLVNIDQTTQRNNPEDRNLHIHRCENLKSYIHYITLLYITLHCLASPCLALPCLDVPCLQ
jgi:hypothetical protein